MSSPMVGYFSVAEESPRNRCFGSCVALTLRHRTQNSIPAVCGSRLRAALTRLMNASSIEIDGHITDHKYTKSRVPQISISLSSCLVAGTWIRVPCSTVFDQRIRKRALHLKSWVNVHHADRRAAALDGLSRRSVRVGATRGEQCEAVSSFGPPQIHE